MAIEVKYRVRIESPAGAEIIETGRIIRLEWERHENKITHAGIELDPAVIARQRSAIFQRHNRIHLYRSVNGGPFLLVARTIWILLAWDVKQTGSAPRVILRAVCANWILGDEEKGAIVAYKSGHASATTAAEVDTAAKSIVAAAMGSGATDYDGNDRDRSAWLQIDEDLPAGLTPAISKSFSMQPIRRILDALAAYALKSGTAWLYDVEATGGRALRFTTYISQTGIARDLTFSFENGNVTEFDFTETYEAEVTAVYIGGAGQGSARAFANAESAAATETPFGRRERMRSYPTLSLTSSLDDAAEHELQIGAGRAYVSIKVQQSPGAIFGIDWKWGDRVSWHNSYLGIAGSDRIAGVRVIYDSSGEQVSARLFSGVPTAAGYNSIDESEIEI